MDGLEVVPGSHLFPDDADVEAAWRSRPPCRCRPRLAMWRSTTSAWCMDLVPTRLPPYGAASSWSSPGRHQMRDSGAALPRDLVQRDGARSRRVEGAGRTGHRNADDGVASVRPERAHARRLVADD